MKIEKAIQQNRPFRNEHHRAAVNIIYSSNWITEQHGIFFKKYDLTPKQYNVLRILKGATTSVSTSIIRERLLDKNGDASRIVARLAKKKLVSKSADKKDKRLVEIVLTPEAELLLAAMAEKESILDDALKKLNTEEARQLNELLNKMRG